MNFVTQTAVRSHLGNKFHEITLAIRKQQGQEPEDKGQQNSNTANTNNPSKEPKWLRQGYDITWGSRKQQEYEQKRE